MRPNTLMEIAFLVAQDSKCCSWKVGAVIEKDDSIISTGYNGTPSNQDNCTEVALRNGWVELDQRGIAVFKDAAAREAHNQWSRCNEIHAEINAILFAARKGMSIEGATMYVTVSPCAECCKTISQSGIKKVVFCFPYDKNVSGWSQILQDSGIEVVMISSPSMNHLNWHNIKTQPSFKNS